jgi:hemolysin III
VFCQLLACDESELAEHYPNEHEKRADGLVHLIGLVFAAVAGVALASFSWARGGLGQATATSLYALCLVAMLACSAVYNLTRPSPHRRLLRRLDEAAIFFMIAGSCTPFTTQKFDGTAAVVATSAIWLAALAGAAGKLFVTRLSDRFWCGIYVGFAWIAGLALLPVSLALPLPALILLGFGGLTYTAGVLIFLKEDAPFRRAVWHGFVVAAAGMHYGAILTGVVWA